MHHGAQQDHASPSPSAPPASEISRASVKSCRKMRARRAPNASRRATSRERSAARAANRLPRLAHAANRINPASSIKPPRNALIAPPNALATPGISNLNEIRCWSTSLG